MTEGFGGFEHVTHALKHQSLGDVVVHVYQHEGRRAVVVAYGPYGSDARPLVRIQSSCLYGDTLGMTDCDCRSQIDEAFRRMRTRGSGILIYTEDEGRGAGLLAKARAYRMQEEQSLDTVDAYEQAGLPVDSRDFGFPIFVLRDLGVFSCFLLTNNPRKLEAVRNARIDVRREPIVTSVTADNASYLRVKQQRMGHLLELPPPQPADADNGPGVSCFVMGSAVMDHVFRLPVNPQLGKARQASEYDRRAGGKGLNQAVALARLGARVTLLTVIGDEADGDQIASVLAAEGVKARFRGSARRSPQTVILQPDNSPPTYIGWLGEQHRTLGPAEVDECAEVLGGCQVVLLTLEASQDAISRALAHARPDALVVLTASPSVDAVYRLDNRVLDRVDIVVGSGDELWGLLSPRPPSGDDLAERAAVDLSDTCQRTVIATDLRAPVRRVIAVNPYLRTPVRVRPPRVRIPGSRGGLIATAVGNTDVLCSALALSTYERGQGSPGRPGFWSSEDSPLADRNQLIDILMKAVLPEAWVASSRGGYPQFPSRGPLFDTWCTEHPAQLEDD
jgi:GTP cyclohydrolase II